MCFLVKMLVDWCSICWRCSILLVPFCSRVCGAIYSKQPFPSSSPNYIVQQWKKLESEWGRSDISKTYGKVEEHTRWAPLPDITWVITPITRVFSPQLPNYTAIDRGPITPFITGRGPSCTLHKNLANRPGGPPKRSRSKGLPVHFSGGFHWKSSQERFVHLLGIFSRSAVWRPGFKQTRSIAQLQMFDDFFGGKLEYLEDHPS